MNTNFSAWTNEKEGNTTDPTEEQIDPTFARHQDTDFPTVEDVTAAAVANAQQVPHQQQGHQQVHPHQHQVIHHQHPHQQQHSHQQQHQHQTHDDHMRAAQAAAELQQVQQHQQHQHAQHQHQLAAAAAAASNLQDSDSNEGEGKMKMASAGSPRPSRPVSGTKRAAQNRSAQKAFRQRKEKYIKDLEQQAAEVNTLKQTIEELRAENLQLRDYTLALQSRVIELSPASSHHPLSTTSQPPTNQSHDSSNVGVPAPPAAVFSGNKMFNNDK
mmetsp:Transcript_6229/g.7700  ORF Transcript_6229/g.7700 Transcript_6229/m.7700 type:complete len:271 (-) Transcript_6229:226-1038(-)